MVFELPQLTKMKVTKDGGLFHMLKIFSCVLVLLVLRKGAFGDCEGNA